MKKIKFEFGASYKKPEPGDLFILHPAYWPSLGYYGYVFEHESKLFSIPAIFAQPSFEPERFMDKCSIRAVDQFIFLAGRVTI